jgi:hypothetical protein
MPSLLWRVGMMKLSSRRDIVYQWIGRPASDIKLLCLDPTRAVQSVIKHCLAHLKSTRTQHVSPRSISINTHPIYVGNHVPLHTRCAVVCEVSINTLMTIHSVICLNKTPEPCSPFSIKFTVNESSSKLCV